MANTVLLKRRTADATAPTAGQLSVGELAWNASSGKLYSKKQDGTVVEIGAASSGITTGKAIAMAMVFG